MPKYKTKKNILPKNLESNYSLNKIWSVYVILQKKKKFYRNCDLKTKLRSFFVCQELSTTSIVQ